MWNSIGFALMNVTAIGVSMASDILEEKGWQSGKLLRAWLIGWQKNIVIESVEHRTDGVIKLKPPEREGWFFRNTSE